MAKSKSYVLGMFPYPSGDGLHVGHVRIYTAVDVMARYLRMAGHEVRSPMGWDAFGLPAENAAIKNKVNPQDIVPRNYNNFRAQMQRLEFDFDWEHELATTDPTYYGLTQWLFLELYKKGLVVHEEVGINWCPKCKTGLANEEVMADGTHERCGTPVGKKNLPQWVMKITEYADRLLDDLTKEQLDWPRGILEMQRNWIGKKEGTITTHKIEGMDEQLETFSAFPAWLFADTFIAIAPLHPLVKTLVTGTGLEQEVEEFVSEAGEITLEQRTAEKYEKKGVFTGRYALDPLNKGRRLPIWVANFALMEFGTGAIRCSGHDERDFEFATKYNIPIEEVVERVDPDRPVSAHGNTGVLKNSGPFSGRAISPELTAEMVEWLVEQGHTRRHINYHLRDWVFSRQRYWGEPIPLVHCAICGVVPLGESELPLTLPYLESYEPTDTGESPLSRVEEWVMTKCPKCGGEARRETDTMPNWAGSCWYHLAFAFWDKDTAAKIEEYKPTTKTPYSEFWREVARPQIDKWLPVDWYLGGAEHAVLHLLYARFWNKVLYDLGHLGFVEPYLRLRSVGMVLAEDGQKMSKSLGNVINPDEVVAEYGSDAVRLYEMFMGPWGQVTAWDKRAMVGMRRYLERIRDASKRKRAKVTTPKLAGELARLVAYVGQAIVTQKFNTAIARQMEFVNSWRADKVGLAPEEIQTFAKTLSPFAPSVAQELWAGTGGEGEVAASTWPTLEEVASEEGTVEMVVQVNGRMRGTVKMTREEAHNEGAVVAAARADKRIQKWIEGDVDKVIFVPGRLVNLVT